MPCGPYVDTPEIELASEGTWSRHGSFEAVLSVPDVLSTPHRDGTQKTGQGRLAIRFPRRTGEQRALVRLGSFSI